MIVSGCYQDETPQVDLQKTVIHATFARETPATRTLIFEDGKVCWNTYEKIGVVSILDLSGGGSYTVFTSTNESPSPSSDFEGSLVIDPNQKYFALYPGETLLEESYWGEYATGTTMPSKGGCRGYLGPSQSWGWDLTFDTFESRENAMMAAYFEGSDDHLAFQNICSGLKFTVAGDEITSVKLRGNNDEIVAGGFYLDFDMDLKPVVTPESENDVKEVVYNTVGTILKNEWNYLFIFPQEFEKGITITLTYEGGDERVIVMDSSIEFKRNIWKKAENLDLRAVQP